MKQLKECLVCNNKNLKIYFDMGEMPLVNNLKRSPEEKDCNFPLVIYECPVCTHKQLSIAVDRKLLFNEYLYLTGVSEKHYSFFLDFVFEQPKYKRVLDIGCNDGILLEEFYNLGSECVGVEPSKIKVENKGIKVIRDFFPTDKVKGKFDCITAFNVFAHNDDPHTFLIEMAKLLKENGRIYILTTPARLDNFYHEHISYFTPQSMMVLAQKCGCEVVSFKKVSMHGESYLFEISHKAQEKEISGFGYHPPLVSYGASASETVLFNFYKIKPEYVVDDNPLKQGKFIPGINSPIVSSDHLARDKRDLTIIVAHHLFDEISAKIKKLRPKNKDRLEMLI